MFTLVQKIPKIITRTACAIAIVFFLFATPVTAPTANAGWPVTDVGNAGTHAVNAASQGSNTAYTVKDYIIMILKQILMAVAKVLLNKLTEATVNWINGGFQGSPRFVAQPTSFFKDIGDTDLKNIVDIVGYNDGKYPYGRQIAKSLIYNYVYQNGSLADKAKFTLDTVAGPNWNKFQTDFKVGGWKTYEAYNQNPANNPFGFLFLGVQDASKAIQTSHNAIQTELNRGQGFLSQKTCVKYREGPQLPDAPANPTDNSSLSTGAQQIDLSTAGGSQWTSGSSTGAPQTPSGTGGSTTSTTTGSTTGGSTGGTTGGTVNQALHNEHQFLLGGATNDSDCLQWKELSPGSVVQSQITRALGSKFSQNELAGALGDSISNIINALTTTLLNKGLGALSTLVSGDSGSSSNAPTWNYDGLTVSGTQLSQDSNAPGGWASGPDRFIDFNALFFKGDNIGLTDDTGNPVSLTLIEDEQRQVDADKKLINIMIGGVETHADGTILHIKSFPEKIRELDYAVPGPKYGWQNRLKDKIQNAQQIWSQRANTRSIKKRKDQAQELAEKLTELADTIPRAMKIQILTTNIPSYPEAQALISNSVGFSLNQNTYVDNYSESLATLARLKSIKARLCGLLLTSTTQPVVDQSCNVILTTPEQPAGLDQFLGQHPDAAAPKPNPFNYLTDSGKIALKSITKAYLLFEKDLPNNTTISEAENTYGKVKSQYDNVDLMVLRINQEKATLGLSQVFKVQYGGVRNHFIQVNPDLPGLLVKVPESQLGTGDKSDLLTNGYHFLYQAPDLDPHISELFGSGAGTQLYINPFNTNTSISGVTPADVSGWSLVTLITDKTRKQMTDELATFVTTADGSSAKIDDDHQKILNDMQDSQVTLVYSIVESTVTLNNLGDGWDPASTGTNRVHQAIELVSAYEQPDESSSSINSSEKIFYCETVLDQYDDYRSFAREAYSSLFQRPRMGIKCEKFYDSDPSDYTLNK
jgi:hypothetical protein